MKRCYVVRDTVNRLAILRDISKRRKLMAMQITPEAKQKIQLFLLAAIVLAAARSGYILYERHEANSQQVNKESAPPLSPDYYVTPKKLYPYDLKSAQQLTQQPVWVKQGYRYTFYPYDASRHHADFSHEAGQLLPLQKLQIKAVVTDLSPGSPDQRQIMAVFQEDGKNYAFPIGSVHHLVPDADGFVALYADASRRWTDYPGR